MYTSTLAIILSIVVLANGLCQLPTIEQQLVHSWQEDGQYYGLWEGKIVNQGADPLKRIYLDLGHEDQIRQIWEIEYGASGHYEFPEWRATNGGVTAGQFHSFGYISRSLTAIPISIFHYACTTTEECICTMEYLPVCGKDGSTYSNDCKRLCHGVEKAKDGEC